MLSTELPDIVTFHLRVLVNKCHEQHEPPTCDAFFSIFERNILYHSLRLLSKKCYARLKSRVICCVFSLRVRGAFPNDISDNFKLLLQKQFKFM